MTKGKSHNRSRSGYLKRIRRGQARKLKAMKGYDRQAYDKPTSEES